MWIICDGLHSRQISTHVKQDFWQVFDSSLYSHQISIWGNIYKKNCLHPFKIQRLENYTFILEANDIKREANACQSNDEVEASLTISHASKCFHFLQDIYKVVLTTFKIKKKNSNNESLHHIPLWWDVSAYSSDYASFVHHSGNGLHIKNLCLDLVFSTLSTATTDLFGYLVAVTTNCDILTSSWYS